MNRFLTWPLVTGNCAFLRSLQLSSVVGQTDGQTESLFKDQLNKCCASFVWNYPILDHELEYRMTCLTYRGFKFTFSPRDPRVTRSTRSLEERGQSEHHTILLKEKICWKWTSTESLLVISLPHDLQISCSVEGSFHDPPEWSAFQ